MYSKNFVNMHCESVSAAESALFYYAVFTPRRTDGIVILLHEDKPQRRRELKRVGLALGGGGAKGIAHIAYLKAMEELGVRPSVISGTSSGAIAGAAYAGGMDPDAMLSELRSAVSGLRIVFERLSRAENRVGASVKRTLQSMLPQKTFEDLEMPLRIVATNFHTLKERVFFEGEIIGPLMASIAYPNVFSPQMVEGEYYVDGGATNIVPFDVIRHECDVLIAIDVSAVRPNDLKPSIKNAPYATWAATQEALISLKLQHCAVEIFERPDLGHTGTFEFHSFNRIFSRAEEAIPGFKQKLKRILEGE